MRPLCLALLAVLAAPLSASGNVLLIIADDVGIDRIRAYEEHPTPGRTPVINQLAAEGVLFRNCWSNPLCSSSRVTIVTGRYSFRTGVGWFLNKFSDLQGMSLGDWTLPELLSVGTQGVYATAHVGKWHMGGLDQGPTHPNDSGFEHFAGSLANLVPPESYFSFEKVVNGSPVSVTTYATTDTVDDAIATIAVFGAQPWFVTVSFNAAHTPYHAPPPHLHDFTLSGEPKDTPIEHHKAMVQAMDTEIGRLLASIDPAVLAVTTILFVSDNGTEFGATEPPWPSQHGKATLFEGGVNVPLIIAGHAVTAKGTECDALVQTTDLYMTVARLAGIPVNVLVPYPLDSRSLVPYLSRPNRPSARDFLYAEMFSPIGDGPYDTYKRAARDERYKLHVDDVNGKQRFYDLLADPFESHDLLPAGNLTPEQSAAYADLHGAMDELLATR